MREHEMKERTEMKESRIMEKKENNWKKDKY